jgi:hypothetical protein
MTFALGRRLFCFVGGFAPVEGPVFRDPAKAVGNSDRASNCGMCKGRGVTEAASVLAARGRRSGPRQGEDAEVSTKERR